MDELKLDEFLYGGVNITGFRLISPDSLKFRQAQAEWQKLAPSTFLGAGRGSKLGVSFTVTELPDQGSYRNKDVVGGLHLDRCLLKLSLWFMWGWWKELRNRCCHRIGILVSAIAFATVSGLKSLDMSGRRVLVFEVEWNYSAQNCCGQDLFPGPMQRVREN